MERDASVPLPSVGSPVERFAGGLFPRRGSRRRLAYDIVFGVVAPPILIYLDLEWDPLGIGGFNASGGIGVLPLRPYTPLLACGAMACLAAWLGCRRRLEWAGAFLAGPLLGGSLLAFGIGLMLFPLSFAAIFILGFGLLGLVPFLTALVFLDAGLEALAAGRVRLGRAPAMAAGGCAGLLLLALAGGGGLLAKEAETRATAVLTGERPGNAARAERRLRILRKFPGAQLRGLETAARKADGARATALADAYERITGNPIPEID